MVLCSKHSEIFFLFGAFSSLMKQKKTNEMGPASLGKVGFFFFSLSFFIKYFSSWVKSLAERVQSCLLRVKLPLFLSNLRHLYCNGQKTDCAFPNGGSDGRVCPCIGKRLFEMKRWNEKVGTLDLGYCG